MHIWINGLGEGDEILDLTIARLYPTSPAPIIVLCRFVSDSLQSCTHMFFGYRAKHAPTSTQQPL